MDAQQDMTLIATENLVQSNNMIAIASGKGGIGKTWFSITLAHALSRRGQNILLFDGNLGLANIDIQLGLEPENDIGNVISGKLTLNQAVFNYEDGGFDIIAGRSGFAGITNTAPSRLHRVGSDLAIISASYDKVIIDLGTGVKQTLRQLTHHVQDLIVIITDEPSTSTDAYAFIKETHFERPQTNIHIVVNAVGIMREGERSYNLLLKACQQFLNISPPLLGVIKTDPKVSDAIKNQSPLFIHSPHCQAAVDVDHIAAKLPR